MKQTDVPGEWTSPTQPIPSKPPGYDIQGLKESDLIDFTPALHQQAMDALKASGLRYGPIYTPGSLANAADGTRGTIALPGLGGGSNWWGGSSDPERGWVYVSSATSPGVIALTKNDPPATPLAPGTYGGFDYRSGGGAAFPTIGAPSRRSRRPEHSQTALRPHHRLRHEQGRYRMGRSPMETRPLP